MIRIKSDSRKVRPGDIFIALRGISSDGHSYIDQAIKNGASKIIAEEGNYSVETLIVPNTRLYLENYLKDNYGHYLEEMKIIGFTGTNGKSTSAFFLYSTLNSLNMKCAYVGTLGYYLDKKIRNLPNTSVEITDLYEMIVESYNKGYRYFVLEVSSQGLAYRRLESIIFDYAIFTNLTQDHLDFHKTMENYALAKQELFRKLKSNGKAIVNIDSQYKDYFLLNNNSNITFGFNNCDYQLLDYKHDKEGISFSYKHYSNVYKISAPIIGKYNIYNLITTIIVLSELGISKTKIEKVIKNLKTPDGRLDTIKYHESLIIIDYAHTPDAINNVIEATKEVTEGDIYAVFGCTGDRDRLKRPIMMKLATDKCKKVIVTIDDPHNEDPNNIVKDMVNGLDNQNYAVELDRKKAIIKGIKLLKSNDTLLILGKGHEEVIIYGKDKIPFNDKQVVLEYINH